tara:strand:+ start:3996 stop:4583 length:588 start_codon:yes stop_codon:yes gene_type:complete
MFKLPRAIKNKSLLKAFMAISLSSSCVYLEAISTKTSASAQSSLQFRWNDDGTYKKLRHLQGSKLRMDRSTYYFFLKRNDRKTAILKLTFKLPENFKATIKEKNVNLCQVRIGGYTTRTKCLEYVPAVVDISNDKKTIDIFPKNPIPANKKHYAVKLKIFNPRNVGMYQINAFSQSPGELPISVYLGSYLVEIDQ